MLAVNLRFGASDQAPALPGPGRSPTVWPWLRWIRLEKDTFWIFRRRSSSAGSSVPTPLYTHHPLCNCSERQDCWFGRLEVRPSAHGWRHLIKRALQQGTTDCNSRGSLTLHWHGSLSGDRPAQLPRWLVPNRGNLDNGWVRRHGTGAHRFTCIYMYFAAMWAGNIYSVHGFFR
jgi:hypothetical protein